MSLKTKIIGAIVASALACPPAFAVEGSDGMHYTSASEGLYASIRAQFHSGGKDGDNSVIQNSGSRFGIQGTGEMSHGLEGFYRYEAALPIDNGSGDFTTRLGHVGLRGGFGSLTAGTMWDDAYNWVYGATDLPNAGGGNFVYTARASNSLLYQSPDFNGLQVAARFEFDGGNENQPADGDWKCDTDADTAGIQGDMDALETSGGNYVCTNPAHTPVNANADETVASNDADLDVWSLTARYAFSGFTVGGTYLTKSDAGMRKDIENMDDGLEDDTSWAVRGGYGQDNWGVNVWYGENNASDFGYDGDSKKQDETVFSISGDVAVGKTKIVVLHESKEIANGGDNEVTVFEIEYNLNSKAKTWVGYVARDNDAASAEKDYFNIGLRHDF